MNLGSTGIPTSSAVNPTPMSQWELAQSSSPVEGSMCDPVLASQLLGEVHSTLGKVLPSSFES